MILLYLMFAVLANIVLVQFGPVAAIPIALIMVGGNITIRDRLHDRWQGQELAARMLLLILTAGVVSYVINPAAGKIATASFIAFLASEVADSLVYDAAKTWPWRYRTLMSNIVSGGLDSFLFFLLAFTDFPIALVFGSWVAKVGGGIVWTFLLRNRRSPTGEGLHEDVYVRLGYRCETCKHDPYPCITCATRGAI